MSRPCEAPRTDSTGPPTPSRRRTRFRPSDTVTTPSAPSTIRKRSSHFRQGPKLRNVTDPRASGDLCRERGQVVPVAGRRQRPDRTAGLGTAQLHLRRLPRHDRCHDEVLRHCCQSRGQRGAGSSFGSTQRVVAGPGQRRRPDVGQMPQTKQSGKAEYRRRRTGSVQNGDPAARRHGQYACRSGNGRRRASDDPVIEPSVRQPTLQIGAVCGGARRDRAAVGGSTIVVDAILSAPVPAESGSPRNAVHPDQDRVRPALDARLRGPARPRSAAAAVRPAGARRYGSGRPRPRSGRRRNRSVRCLASSSERPARLDLCAACAGPWSGSGCPVA